MPDTEHRTMVLERARHWDDLSQTKPGDQATVASALEHVAALTNAGLFYEARQVCTDLLFDFQPLLIARPTLLQQFTAALRGCKAEHLLRRLTIAVNGELV